MAGLQTGMTIFDLSSDLRILTRRYNDSRHITMHVEDLLAEFPALEEADAQPKIKAVLTDVNGALGTASAPLVFRQLAMHPYFLQLAWRNLKPNAETVYFNNMTSEIRDMAIHAVGSTRSKVSASDPEGVVRSRLSAFSKLLLGVGALRAGANGQIPKVSWISPEEKGVYAASGDTKVVDLDESGPEVASFSRVDEAVDELHERATILVEALPYRMEISPTACRQSGLREDEIDQVRRILNAAWNAIPRDLLSAAAAASKSPPREPRRTTAAEVAGASATD